MEKYIDETVCELEIIRYESDDVIAIDELGKKYCIKDAASFLEIGTVTTKEFAEIIEG